MSISDDIRQSLVPPHPAGRPFILGGIVALLFGLAVGTWLVWLGLIFTLFCLFFFRDPERVPPPRPGLFLAPADGRIVSVTKTSPPAELGLGTDQRWKVSIFLSVLNVHVNRSPIGGVVTKVAYHHGAFVSASLDKASESNERNALAIRLPNGQDIAVVQIAGLIARRILCFVKEGDMLTAGERFGLIRFGSRTDLYLPAGVEPLVVIGQSMVGGETVMAALPS